MSPIIQRINRLAERVRKSNGTIIFVQHDGDGINTVAPNTPGWEIFSGLEVESHDIKVNKTLNDSFAHTSLDSTLKEQNIERLLITGWATDFCVDSTIRSAVNHGYSLVIISDCHTVMDRPHLKANQVIEHHHWLWENLITGDSILELCTADIFIEGL